MEYIPDKMRPRDMFEKALGGRRCVLSFEISRGLNGDVPGSFSTYILYRYIKNFSTPSRLSICTKDACVFLQNHGSIQDHIDTHCKCPEIRFLNAGTACITPVFCEDF